MWGVSLKIKQSKNHNQKIKSVKNHQNTYFKGTNNMVVKKPQSNDTRLSKTMSFVFPDGIKKCVMLSSVSVFSIFFEKRRPNKYFL